MESVFPYKAYKERILGVYITKHYNQRNLEKYRRVILNQLSLSDT